MADCFKLKEQILKITEEHVNLINYEIVARIKEIVSEYIYNNFVYEKLVINVQ